MGAALRSELTKLLTTRMWWILALVMFAYLALVGGFFAFAMTLGDPGTGGLAEGEDAARMVYGLGNAIGYAFPLLAGTLLVTGEFRHRTIAQTLLAEPRRGVVLGSKLLVSIPVGLVYGLAGVLGIVGAGALILEARGDGAYLGSADVWEVIVLSVVVTVLWTVIGAAFGAVLTQQVAAIVVILVFTQFVEPIARVALTAVDGLEQVSRFLPGAAADGLIGSSFFATGGSVDLLPQPAAAAVMVAYVVVFALVGRFTTFRRDLG
ncbi:ABC transporter permease [Nocardioides zeae]|uniref:ABC transporter permease n=1 Tax=Nocardioides imazamoxiresistens TaxID=3231893 RepID=A0ABU3PT17_9ACTN|nr:ABC transporter permease [Nocardioides zeae]MDT9592366.1 ABC transporter permease [Nocardioides zeae]